VTERVARLSYFFPAHNEEALLGRTLAALHESARELSEPYEVVVANDASTDRTGQIALEHAARVVAVDRRQIAATRNAGAQAAMGELLIFVDADQNGAVGASATEPVLVVNEALAGNNTLTSAGLTNTPVNVLQFRPSGAANVPANVTFKLCDSRTGLFGRTITLSPTGRATSATTSCP
jgi:hypothetical protein